MVGVGLVIPHQLPTAYPTTITFGGGVGLAIPLQLPTPHSITITFCGGGAACDSPFSYPHYTLLQSLLAVDVGLVIHLQLPTPHSTTITSGGVGVACDSPSVTHTTVYYSHFWW